MSRLQESLLRACEELGLRIELDARGTLSSGRDIQAVARIPQLGAARGMLIFRSYQDLEGLGDELVSAGYGYSVLSEPPPNESWSIDSYKEMFSDWGWASESEEAPAWLTPASETDETPSSGTE
jgi:hypothetical protein